MASITCKVGGTAHTHFSVAEVRECTTQRMGFLIQHEAIETVKLPRPAERCATPVRSDITEDVVPDGRYAVDTNEFALNATAFYVVKWWDGRKGRMSSVYLQVSDVETRLPFKNGLSVLRQIAEVGAKEASIRYGRELGVCGVCGRTLTNDESRAAGIGPTCAAKF